MDLTQNEQRALTRIRKWQKEWRWYRWVVLLLALVSTGTGAWVRREFMEQLPDLATGAAQMPEVTFLLGHLAIEGSVMATMMYYGGFFLAIWVIGRWRGDATDILVLRLWSELEREGREFEDKAPS